MTHNEYRDLPRLHGQSLDPRQGIRETEERIPDGRIVEDDTERADEAVFRIADDESTWVRVN